MQILYTLAIALLLTACSRWTQNSQLIDFDQFPNEWIKLTPTDSGKILFHLCDANISRISIFKNPKRNNLLQLNYEYGQDTGVFDVNEVSRNDSTVCYIRAVDILAKKRITFKIEFKDSDWTSGFWSTSEDNFNTVTEFVQLKFKDKFKEVQEKCD